MYVADREALRKRVKHLIPQMNKIFERKKIINFKNRLRIRHPITVAYQTLNTDQLLEREAEKIDHEPH